MQLFKKPVTPVLRVLVISYLSLSVPAIAFQMHSLGTASFFVLPCAAVLSWIYHLINIIRDNKSTSPHRRNTTISVYSSNASLGCGWILAALWAAGWIIDVVVRIRFDFYGYGYPIRRFVVIFDLLFNLTALELMLAVMVAAQKQSRREGKVDREGFKLMQTV